MAWLIRGVPAVVLLLVLSGAAEARDYYGAIAYSKTTRAQGYVYDQEFTGRGRVRGARLLQRFG